MCQFSHVSLLHNLARTLTDVRYISLACEGTDVSLIKGADPFRRFEFLLAGYRGLQRVFRPIHWCVRRGLNYHCYAADC
jgi:hypothetical protein